MRARARRCFWAAIGPNSVEDGPKLGRIGRRRAEFGQTWGKSRPNSAKFRQAGCGHTTTRGRQAGGTSATHEQRRIGTIVQPERVSSRAQCLRTRRPTSRAIGHTKRIGLPGWWDWRWGERWVCRAVHAIGTLRRGPRWLVSTCSCPRADMHLTRQMLQRSCLLKARCVERKTRHCMYRSKELPRSATRTDATIPN